MNAAKQSVVGKAASFSKEWISQIFGFPMRESRVIMNQCDVPAFADNPIITRQTKQNLGGWSIWRGS
jgi:hypothetical protein